LSEEYEYFEHDNAKFRRRGGFGGVDDVLHGKTWKPYKGDRTRAYLMGDRIDDPLTRAVTLSGQWDFFEHDNAKFRRRRCNVGPVDDVLHGETWVPCGGNRTDPALYGNRIADPLAGAGEG